MLGFLGSLTRLGGSAARPVEPATSAGETDFVTEFVPDSAERRILLARLDRSPITEHRFRPMPLEQLVRHPLRPSDPVLIGAGVLMNRSPLNLLRHCPSVRREAERVLAEAGFRDLAFLAHGGASLVLLAPGPGGPVLRIRIDCPVLAARLGEAALVEAPRPRHPVIQTPIETLPAGPLKIELCEPLEQSGFRLLPAKTALGAVVPGDVRRENIGLRADGAPLLFDAEWVRPAGCDPRGATPACDPRRDSAGFAGRAVLPQPACTNHSIVPRTLRSSIQQRSSRARRPCR